MEVVIGILIFIAVLFILAFIEGWVQNHTTHCKECGTALVFWEENEDFNMRGKPRYIGRMTCPRATRNLYWGYDFEWEWDHTHYPVSKIPNWYKVDAANEA